LAQAKGTAQQVGAAGLRLLAGEAQQTGDRRPIHQAPLAPKAHQRPLQGRRPLQAGQLGGAQGPIAQHRLPFKTEHPRQIQAGAAPRRGRLAPLAGGRCQGAGPHRQPLALAQATGQQQCKARFGQQG
jgi:hypothetical protein